MNRQLGHRRSAKAPASKEGWTAADQTKKVMKGSHRMAGHRMAGWRTRAEGLVFGGNGGWRRGTMRVWVSSIEVWGKESGGNGGGMKPSGGA